MKTWASRALLSAVLLVLTYTAAHAQAAQSLNQIVQAFQTSAGRWQGTLQSYALGTFGILAVIDLAWAATKLMIPPRADPAEFFGALINEVMFLGLFGWLMTTTNTWGPAIINSFMQAANSAGGVASTSPSDVLMIGVNLSGQILDALRWWAPKSSFVLVVAGCTLDVVFAYVVIAMVVALVESWFVIGSSVFFLAFGGSRWTKDIAIGVIRHIFGLGTRLFALQMIAAIAAQFGRQWVGQLGNMDNQTVMLILGCSVVLAGCAWEIPKSMERMVNGTSTTHAGGVIGAGLGMIGATAAVGGAALTAATALAGIGSSISEGARLANEQIKASDAPPSSGISHAAQMVGKTAMNVGAAMATDAYRKATGQSSGAGSASWRMSADMSNQRRLLAEDQTRPASQPANSIGTNKDAA